MPKPDFLEAVRSDPGRKPGSPCVTCAWIASLDPDLAAQVVEGLADRGIATSVLHAHMKARGFEYTQSAVENHRRSHV